MDILTYLHLNKVQKARSHRSTTQAIISIQEGVAVANPSLIQCASNQLAPVPISTVKGTESSLLGNAAPSITLRITLPV